MIGEVTGLLISLKSFCSDVHMLEYHGLFHKHKFYKCKQYVDLVVYHYNIKHLGGEAGEYQVLLPDRAGYTAISRTSRMTEYELVSGK